MTEPNPWARISAYMAGNRLNTALEAVTMKEKMAFEASDSQKLANKANNLENGNDMPNLQNLDCIYDDEPLGFEKDPSNINHKMQAQDTLQEIDIGDGLTKRPTYISANINSDFKTKLIELLQEYKDCFAWDYNEMPGLSKELVEHRLPLKPEKKPIKQLPRRFAPEIMSKIKGEIERLLRSKFIRTARYVQWLANIVPVIKKNGTLRVCQDQRRNRKVAEKQVHSNCQVCSMVSKHSSCN